MTRYIKLGQHLDSSKPSPGVLPDLDEGDDVLAEDAGVGHHCAEHEHDAGQQPQRERSHALTRESM